MNEKCEQIIKSIHLCATSETHKLMAKLIMDTYRTTDYSLLTLLTKVATAIQTAIIAKSIDMRRKMLDTYTKENEMTNAMQDTITLNDDKAQYQRFASVPHFYHFPMYPKLATEAISQLTYFLRAPAVYNLQTPTFEDCEDKSLYATEFPTPLKLKTNKSAEGAFCQPSAIAMRLIH